MLKNTWAALFLKLHSIALDSGRSIKKKTSEKLFDFSEVFVANNPVIRPNYDLIELVDDQATT